MGEFEDCVLALQFADGRRGPYVAPLGEEVWIGRADECAVRLAEEWVPRQVARVIWTDRAWLLMNGPSTRMRVKSPWLDNALVASGGMIALQPGSTVVAWPELDDRLRLSAKVGPDLAHGIEVVHNSPGFGHSSMRTAYAAAVVGLSQERRRNLAVVFRHLILGTEQPANIARTAAAELGMSEQAVKNMVTRVTRWVNEERWENLQGTEQLGEYLVRTSRTLTVDDLPPALKSMDGLPT